jgi:hypothetical protein
MMGTARPKIMGLEGSLHGQDERITIQGLLDEVIGAFAECLLRDVFIGMSGYQQNGGPRTGMSHVSEEIKSAHTRHFYVADDGMVLCLLNLF